MKEYKIRLKEPKIKELESISLLMENCDEIEIFQDEIEEIALDFKSDLILSGSGIIRCLKSGFIKISLKEKYNKYREPLMGMPNRRKRPKTEELIERLNGVCDITYLKTRNVGYSWIEKIEVPYEELEDEETGRLLALKVCSSAKLDNEGKLIILMGDKSEYNMKQKTH